MTAHGSNFICQIRAFGIISPRPLRSAQTQRVLIGRSFPLEPPQKDKTMPPTPRAEQWPELPYAAWKDTCETLRLWTQIVGKIRLAQTPWLNHSWHVALYVTARGLTTSPIPYGVRSFQLDFDFIDHVLWVQLSEGQFRQVMLKPMSVAEFYEDVVIALRELEIDAPIETMPCEIADCIPFEQDTMHAAYDAGYANRFWRVLLAVQEIFAHFRTSFLGKTSP